MEDMEQWTTLDQRREGAIVMPSFRKERSFIDCPLRAISVPSNGCGYETGGFMSLYEGYRVCLRDVASGSLHL